MKKNILKTSAYLLASCLENWGSGKKYHFHKKETCITKGKQKINNKSLFLQYRVKYVCKITTRNIVSSLSYELKEVFSLQKQPFADVLQNSYSKNIRNFARKHLRWSLFSTACNFIKKRHHQRCFPVNFAKFLKSEQLRATVSQSLKYKTWLIEKNRSLWKTLNEVF